MLDDDEFAIPSSARPMMNMAVDAATWRFMTESLAFQATGLSAVEGGSLVTERWMTACYAMLSEAVRLEGREPEPEKFRDLVDRVIARIEFNQGKGPTNEDDRS